MSGIAFQNNSTDNEHAEHSGRKFVAQIMADFSEGTKTSGTFLSGT
jgi:hypothetical protein